MTSPLRFFAPWRLCVSSFFSSHLLKTARAKTRRNRVQWEFESVDARFNK